MRRIWCEFLSPQILRTPALYSTLAEYGVILNYKVEYGKLDEDLWRMLADYNAHDVEVSLWLTLDDRQGYWINERNCEAFKTYVEEVLELLEKQNLKIRGICIDMEPPVDFVRQMNNPQHKLDRLRGYAQMITVNQNFSRYHQSIQTFTAIAELLERQQLEGMAVGMHYLYYDLLLHLNVVQNALETPLFAVPWDIYNFMYYTTLIKQKHPQMDDKQLNGLLTRQVGFLQRKLGDKLALSVGLTNTGKLYNEACYSGPADLKRDITVLKACGVNDFSLFSLDGLLDLDLLKAYLNVME